MPDIFCMAGLITGLLLGQPGLNAPTGGLEPQPSFIPAAGTGLSGSLVRPTVMLRVRPERMGVLQATAAAVGVESMGSVPADVAADTALGDVLASMGVTLVRPSVRSAPIEPQVACAIGLERFCTLELQNTADAQQLAQLLARRTDLFEVVELDAPGGIHGVALPSDPFFPWQYGLRNTGIVVGGVAGTPGSDINAPGAWLQAAGVGASVTLAIIDTGVSRSHPDLSARLVPGQNFIGADPDDTDDSPWVSHGTACAGIAAARSNDNYGMAGVSWNASIMPIRVADAWGNSSEQLCATGIIWAVDHGARVLNISLGFTVGTAYLRAAVEYALASGAVIVSSSGNAAGQPVYYPARLPGVICVTATDNRDHFAAFSCIGPEVDVSAPGVLIVTTVDTNQYPNTHRQESGTSMAAPFVAGVACLLLESSPWLSGAEVRRIILDTADDKGPPGWDPQFGHGRVNAARALAAVAGSDTFCISDWDRNGEVAPDDLFLFLTDYFAGQGDANGDGITDSLDISTFLTAYMSGC